MDRLRCARCGCDLSEDSVLVCPACGVFAPSLTVAGRSLPAEAARQVASLRAAGSTLRIQAEQGGWTATVVGRDGVPVTRATAAVAYAAVAKVLLDPSLVSPGAADRDAHSDLTTREPPDGKAARRTTVAPR